MDTPSDGSRLAKTVGSLLAPTDFTSAAGYAARRAALVASEQSAQLDVLHVMSGSGLKTLREAFQPAGQVEREYAEDAEIRLKDKIEATT